MEITLPVPSSADAKVPTIDPNDPFSPRPAPPAALPEKVEVALVSISESLHSIAEFVGGANLMQVVESKAIMDCVGQILNGLMRADGRKGLDARTTKQNAIESTHAIMECFKHLKQHVQELRDGERSEEIVNAESDYEEWKKKNASQE